MAFAFAVRAPSCSGTIAVAWATAWATDESMAASSGTAAATIEVGSRTATRVMYTGTDMARFSADLPPSTRQSREQGPPR